MSGEIAIRHEEDGAPAVAFRLLGAFQMTVSGQPWPPGPEQEQRLFVKLLAAKAMPVANSELMEAIWDEVPGPGATPEALHHLVAALRRRLAAAGRHGVLTNGKGTYRLGISPGQVDVHVFRALAARARDLARDGDPRAIALLEEALGLRGGEPLAGLRGRWIDGYRHTLTEELRAAELALYETAIRHGESRERLPALSTLLRDRPDDELVAWLNMHALYRAGQQTEALAVKRRFAEHLLETNGLENGKALDELYRRILDRDDGLLAPEAVGFPAGEADPRVRHPGRPGPRFDQDRERAEPRQPPAGSDGTSPDDPAGGERRETAAGPGYVFNGPVHARGTVFGTQINNYGRRR